jgi:membrane protein required for beta-lactamase induction
MISGDVAFHEEKFAQIQVVWHNLSFYLTGIFSLVLAGIFSFILFCVKASRATLEIRQKHK